MVGPIDPNATAEDAANAEHFGIAVTEAMSAGAIPVSRAPPDYILSYCITVNTAVCSIPESLAPPYPLRRPSLPGILCNAACTAASNVVSNVVSNEGETTELLLQYNTL